MRPTRAAISALGAAWVLAACASSGHDHALRWDSQSAVLHVRSPQGDAIPVLDGPVLGVPGYLFSRGTIRLHPGRHAIAYACPRSDGIVVHDAIPAIDFHFRAGHAYELRCENGEPVISERAAETEDPSAPPPPRGAH